jgi:alanyl-tRNA synthetase
MQFDRDASGKLHPLPKPSIDTGMGLERVTAVLQSVISNYDTDLFTPLIKRAAELTGTAEGHVGTAAPGRPVEQSSAEGGGHKSAASLRVIADHSRAATFLICDGVLPSNEGRGYVLRKIIRRAITHGRLLGQEKPFLHEMVFAVRDLMQDAYPELKETAARASKIVQSEETRFAHTVDRGLKEWEHMLDAERYQREERATEQVQEEESVADRLLKSSDPEAYQKNFSSRVREKLNRLPPIKMPGVYAFTLYDTFGLPLDFLLDAARDQGVEIDQAGFDRAMAEQRERARASWKGGSKLTANPEYQKLPASKFEGYYQTVSAHCLVLGVFRADAPLTRELQIGEEGEIILDHTPFYADSGGQVGDVGWLYDSEGNVVVADVLGCYMPVQGVRFHKVRARQHIEVGDIVRAIVNTDIRESTMRNHTATHLLQAGLREVLGKHVKQAGSLVAPDHLRFDFSHFTSVADEELQDIEDLINKEVLRNEKIEVIENVPIDVAINEYKAMALFGEKYGDRVRVIKIGDFSTELCGGTHTNATGEIGLIKVLKEGSVSSGVRRIEAVTGEGSLHHFQKDHKLESVVANLATHSDAVSPADALKLELDKKDSEIKRLQRELDQARMKSATSTVVSVTDKIKDINGIKVLAHRVDNLERAQMRTLVDQLRDKLGSGVVVLGSATNGNVALIVGVTKDLTQKIQAGKVIGPVAQRVGGKGGGRPDLAEAGGKDPSALDAALADAYGVVESMLG